MAIRGQGKGEAEPVTARLALRPAASSLGHRPTARYMTPVQKNTIHPLAS